VSGVGVIQTRSFSYDRAGLLQSETHPERGAAGNGSTTYPSYDSSGHLLRRIAGANDLTFAYDPAERLFQVQETTGAQRILKSFNYASANPTFTDPVTGLETGGSEWYKQFHPTLASISRETRPHGPSILVKVKNLGPTNSAERSAAKVAARAKSSPVARSMAEAMRPIGQESSRVGGTASKTNARN
jgi:hypothetical protein